MVYNFTKGKITGAIIKFSIPIFFALLLQTLYGAVDLMIVGQFGTNADVSAVSTGAQLIHTLTMVVASFSIGTTILVGQMMGSGEKEEIGRVIACGIVLYAGIAVVMTFITVGLTQPLTAALNAPREAFQLTKDYIRICGAGSIFVVSYNIIGGIFRGIGDSKTPLLAVVVATISNILGDLLLVGYFKMGTAGAAYATIFSQGISVAITLYYASKNTTLLSIKREDFKAFKKYAGKTTKLGAPIAIQTMLVNFSFLAILAIINQIGLLASSGVGITQKLVGFLMLVPSAFSQTLATFTAQNVGADAHERCRKGLKVCIVLSLFVSVFFTYFCFAHGDILLKVFSKDQEVILAGWQYLKAYALDVLMTSFMFCFVGYFNGYGKTGFVMFQGIVGAMGVRVPLSYCLAQIEPVSLFTIGLATPASTLVQNILCILYFIYLNQKIRRKNNVICV